MMVRDFQKIIGEETKRQLMEVREGFQMCCCLCWRGSNAMGIFYDFIPNESVRLVGAEAAGKGIDTKLHAATIAKGSTGIFHGMKSLFCKMMRGRLMQFIPFQQD